MSDRLAEITYDTIVGRHLLLRSFFDPICHSVPLYLVLGNHEGEQGKDLDGTPNNLAVWATLARKLYYPNPFPDDFYRGCTTIEEFVGLRENYYAWKWGDALFVVIDPYWYTLKRGNSDRWHKTLGDEQYAWLKQTLEESGAKSKFVFCHQLSGGKNNEGRGGIEYAGYYEWGGLNDDDTWGLMSNVRDGRCQSTN